MNGLPGEITREQVEQMKNRMFSIKSLGTDEETLGTAVSQFLQWDGGAIIRAFYYALEDANFHQEAGEIDSLYSWAFKEDEEIKKANDR